MNNAIAKKVAGPREAKAVMRAMLLLNLEPKIIALGKWVRGIDGEIIEGTEAAPLRISALRGSMWVTTEVDGTTLYIRQSNRDSKILLVGEVRETTEN